MPEGPSGLAFPGWPRFGSSSNEGRSYSAPTSPPVHSPESETQRVARLRMEDKERILADLREQQQRGEREAVIFGDEHWGEGVAHSEGRHLRGLAREMGLSVKRVEIGHHHHGDGPENYYPRVVVKLPRRRL